LLKLEKEICLRYCTSKLKLSFALLSEENNFFGLTQIRYIVFVFNEVYYISLKLKCTEKHLLIIGNIKCKEVKLTRICVRIREEACICMIIMPRP
jgi:hypothetical protein